MEPTTLLDPIAAIEQGKAAVAEAMKHTRFVPNIGEKVRINGEDPQALYTVQSFKDKGKRTTLAVLEAPGMGYRELAVSNLLPPLKRAPKVETTPSEIAEIAGSIALTSLNRRDYEKAALAYLRIVQCPPAPLSPMKARILKALGIDCPPAIDQKALAIAISFALAAE